MYPPNGGNPNRPVSMFTHGRERDNKELPAENFAQIKVIGVGGTSVERPRSRWMAAMRSGSALVRPKGTGPSPRPSSTLRTSACQKGTNSARWAHTWPASQRSSPPASGSVRPPGRPAAACPRSRRSTRIGSRAGELVHPRATTRLISVPSRSMLTRTSSPGSR